MRLLSIILFNLIIIQSAVAANPGYTRKQIKAIKIGSSIKDKKTKEEIALTCVESLNDTCEFYQLSSINKVDGKFVVKPLVEGKYFTIDDLQRLQEQVKETSELVKKAVPLGPKYLLVNELSPLMTVIMITIFPMMLAFLAVDFVTLPFRAPFVAIRRAVLRGQEKRIKRFHAEFLNGTKKDSSKEQVL
jgi:hypothetical protein